MENIRLICNHGVVAYNKDNQPICPICECTEIQTERPDLTGRVAKCSYCSKTTPSDWNLPFFKYHPDKREDEYYSGCFGWD